MSPQPYLDLLPLCQEAVVQYEQYEQEVKNLQRLIEEAHRIIQDRPVSTNNIQELQAQIHHHEVREDTHFEIKAFALQPYYM